MTKQSPLFNINLSTGVEPGEGTLLVAEPFLRENYFNHAVIMMIEYEPGATAMGTVLNIESEYTLDRILDGVTTKNPVRVYCGGPVAGDRLYFMHTFGDLIPETRPVAPGLYVGGDFDTVLSIINGDYDIEGHIRFFVGYSGWSPGQLEEEISKKVWAVTLPGDPRALLSRSGDTLWHDEVRRLGPDYRGWRYHPKDIMAN